MCKRRFLDIDIFGPTCQLSLGQKHSAEQYRKILTIFDYVNVFVLKSFKKWSIISVKSNECRSALRKLQHSNPYNSIGKHLDLISSRITTSEARFSSLPNTPLTAPKNDHFEWLKEHLKERVWQRRSRDISFQRPMVNIDHRWFVDCSTISIATWSYPHTTWFLYINLHVNSDQAA